MSTFGDYARYYNLLYQDKDYEGETAFVLNTLMAHGPKPETLLDLGCGTGRHVLEMMRRGVRVTGVDMSETMLAMGKDALAQETPPSGINLPELHSGDARTVRLGRTFDAVTSLFHVMSYQNTEEDALAVLETARIHLKPGGFFLFDFWYGPGVLTDPPTQRTKTAGNSHTRLIRKAIPVHRVNENLVEVHYAVSLIAKDTGEEARLDECHTMRYWFLPELRYLARHAGFQPQAHGAWLTEDALHQRSWNAWMVARR